MDLAACFAGLSAIRCSRNSTRVPTCQKSICTLGSDFIINRNDHLSSSCWPHIGDLRILGSCCFKITRLHLADAFVIIKIKLDFLAIQACFQSQLVPSVCEQNAEWIPKTNCKILFKIGSWHQCRLFWAAWHWELMHKLTPNYPGSLCRRKRCFANVALQCIVVTGMQPFALVDTPGTNPACYFCSTCCVKKQQTCKLTPFRLWAYRPRLFVLFPYSLPSM